MKTKETRRTLAFWLWFGIVWFQCLLLRDAFPCPLCVFRDTVLLAGVMALGAALWLWVKHHRHLSAQRCRKSGGIRHCRVSKCL